MNGCTARRAAWAGAKPTTCPAMPETPNPEDELAGTEQPFVQHLMELRDRLVKAMIAIGEAAKIAWRVSLVSRNDSSAHLRYSSSFRILKAR